MVRHALVIEDDGWKGLLPLTWWKSCSELRIGRETLLSRQQKMLQSEHVSCWVRPALMATMQARGFEVFSNHRSDFDVILNARWMIPKGWIPPTHPCVGMIDGSFAFCVTDDAIRNALSSGATSNDIIGLMASLQNAGAPGTLVRYPWDLVKQLHSVLLDEWSDSDIAVLSQVDLVYPADAEKLHIGKQVAIHPSVCLRTESGPIYISDGVKIGPFAVIDGPAWIGPHCVINPHAWIHGGNAIGPVCKVGGEIDGTIIQGYSNKQHHGFLGHAVVGAWVNIGAGATNSDLKNNYGVVQSFACREKKSTGTAFFGCTIGDHAKIGIQSSIPTGASIGFATTISGVSHLPAFVPSCQWLRPDGMEPADCEKTIATAQTVMQRRAIEMHQEEIELMKQVFQEAPVVERITA